MRERRAKAYFEEIYCPELVDSLSEGKWGFKNDKGPTECFFEADKLKPYLEAGGNRKFDDVTFTKCDFQGYFCFGIQLVFNNCHFRNCDLSLSTFENVKFSNCKFDNVSFGQTILKNCEFRRCVWHRIAMSPNGTEMHGTYISNPRLFIEAASTNLDESVLSRNGKTVAEQKLRLENTKAAVARRLLKMLQQEGGEDTFYESVRTFLLQNATSEMASQRLKSREAKGRLKKIKCEFSRLNWLAEREIIRIFGHINRWGASVFRPILYMFLSFTLFSILYYAFSNNGIFDSTQKSFDITILAGYSIYFDEKSYVVRLIQNTQIILSVVFYSLFFATIINRISRVR